MTLSPRQRFWLTVLAVITLPVWIVLAIPALIICALGLIAWEMADDLVAMFFPDGRKRPARMTNNRGPG